VQRISVEHILSEGMTLRAAVSVVHAGDIFRGKKRPRAILKEDGPQGEVVAPGRSAMGEGGNRGTSTVLDKR